MANDVEIQGLEFQIIGDSVSAEDSLNKLKDTLVNLKTAVKGGVSGVRTTARQIEALKTALSGFDTKAQILTDIAAGLGALSAVGNAKISSSIPNQITALKTALNGLNENATNKLAELGMALKPLGELGRAHLTSYINQLSQLPDLIRTLDEVDLTKFTHQMEDLAVAIKPFADEMVKVASGFSAFPSRIQRLITSTDQYNNAVKKATTNTSLWGKITKSLNFASIISALRRIATLISKCIKESNEYQENLNLFTVAMGESAEKAYTYAEQVRDALGIDLSNWIKNQGVFNTLLTGFGNVADRAYIMSRNLTQLGYDLSSFFNISVDDAMEKLQSGISGELEPLRRLGYDLSQAKLEAVALSLGIDKTVSSMTQAEKAELRYYAIMTQVTSAQGDLARTLESPANQLRILQAQLSMCAREIGNVFIPALNNILPYAIAVMQVIREIAAAIAELAGFILTEVDYSGVSSITSNAESATDAVGNTTDAIKQLKTATAGFDELNVISQDTDTGVTSTDTSSTGLGFELPSYDFLGDAIESRVDEIKTMIESSLCAIEMVAGEFAFAIGLILVTSGVNIPVGLALLAAGAALYTHSLTADWNSVPTSVGEVLTKMSSLVSGALFGLGVVMLVSGQTAIGIGLMIAGFAAMGAAGTAVWNSCEDPLASALEGITNILAGGMLAIGALMAFSGVDIPMGIAFMVAGAAVLGSSAAIDWKSIENPVSSVLTTLEVILGGAELALGAILAFTGINIPLGVGLMAIGAATLFSAVALNWSDLSDKTKHVISVIEGIVGTAFLVLGAILTFSGGSLVLGIALLAGGALMLANTISLNWNTVSNTIKRVVSGITAILSGASLVLGALLCLSGAGLGLGLALIAAGLAGSFAAWSLDSNPLTNFIRKVANGVIGIINKVIDAINEMFHISFDGLTILGKELIPAFEVELIKIPNIPKFANGGFVDEGQLFIAREAGAEMVGSMNNHTAVANNDQIVEGIREGVYEAVVAAMANTTKKDDMIVKVFLDGREITANVEKHQRERGASLMGSQVYAY